MRLDTVRLGRVRLGFIIIMQKLIKIKYNHFYKKKILVTLHRCGEISVWRIFLQHWLWRIFHMQNDFKIVAKICVANHPCGEISSGEISVWRMMGGEFFVANQPRAVICKVPFKRKA